MKTKQTAVSASKSARSSPSKASRQTPDFFRGEAVRMKVGEMTVCFQGLVSCTELNEPLLRKSLEMFGKKPEEACFPFDHELVLPADIAPAIKKVWLANAEKHEIVLVLGQNGGQPSGMEVSFKSKDKTPYVSATQNVRGLKDAFVSAVVFVEEKK